MTMPSIVKRGERLALRELTLEDAHNLWTLYNDPVVTNNLSFDSRTHDEIHTLIGRAMAAHTQDRVEYLLAAEFLDESFIGVARLALDVEPVDMDLPVGPSNSAQLGGAIRPNHWRQGYAFEVAELLMDLGFNDLGLHRLWGARGPNNVASRHLMVKLGMIEESRLRDHVFTNGAWRDSIVHVILRPDYLRTRSSLR
jgi:RimJ/RimL family protein N-acetyltransferase